MSICGRSVSSLPPAHLNQVRLTSVISRAIAVSIVRTILVWAIIVVIAVIWVVASISVVTAVLVSGREIARRASSVIDEVVGTLRGLLLARNKSISGDWSS
jgi:hypothetical protein